MNIRTRILHTHTTTTINSTVILIRKHSINLLLQSTIFRTSQFIIITPIIVSLCCAQFRFFIVVISISSSIVVIMITNSTDLFGSVGKGRPETFRFIVTSRGGRLILGWAEEWGEAGAWRFFGVIAVVVAAAYEGIWFAACSAHGFQLW